MPSSRGSSWLRDWTGDSGVSCTAGGFSTAEPLENASIFYTVNRLHLLKFYYILYNVTEKAMASHSSTLAWKIPWMEEPGGLQSMGLLRVRNDWATSLSRIGEGNDSPLQCSCLENPRDGGAWWADIYGVAQSRTRLKRLSSRSSIQCKLMLHA